MPLESVSRPLPGLRLLLPAVLVCIAGSSLPSARAQDKDDDPELVESVEVEADSPVEDVAAFATTLTGDELTRRGADLADLLRRVPGARVRDFGGLGRFATVSFRASTAEQVTILVDGVPQNRALGGAVDLSFIPATQIERVTVYRGFGPAGFGLGGIGGLVDIRTRAPGDKPSLQVDALGGEMQTARLSAGASMKAGERGGLRIGAEWLESEGDFHYLDTRATPFDSSDDEERSRQNNDVRQGALLLSGEWSGIGGGRLGFHLRAQDRDSGVPGIDHFPAEHARLDQDLQDGRLSWSWQRNTGFARSLDLALDGFRHTLHFRNPEGELGRPLQDQTTRLTGGGVSAVFRASVQRHQLLTRVDLRREQASVRDTALGLSDRGGAQRDLLAGTFEDVIPLGRVVLAPSMRWEHRDDDFLPGDAGGPAPAGEDVSDDLWSGKLGVAVRLGGGCHLRGSGGTFFRTPNLLELFGDQGAVVGNPELQPEKGNAAELGVDCTRDDGPLPWNFEVVGFGRDSDDLIVFVANSRGTAVARNISSAKVRGVEGSLGLRWRSWRLDASGTWQDTEDTSGGFADGNPLVGIPDRSGYLGLGWEHRGLALLWEVTYVGENSTTVLDDDPDTRLGSRTLHDANVRYRWSRGLTVGLDVRNLFDRETRDVARFPLPDRLVFLHVGWRMGSKA